MASSVLQRTVQSSPRSVSRVTWALSAKRLEQTDRLLHLGIQVHRLPKESTALVQAVEFQQLLADADQAVGSLPMSATNSRVVAWSMFSSWRMESVSRRMEAKGS